MARDFSKTLTNQISLGTNEINSLISGASAVSFHAMVKLRSVDSGANDNRLFNYTIDGAGNDGLIMILVANGNGFSTKLFGRSVLADSALISGLTNMALNTWNSVGGTLDFAGDYMYPYANGLVDNAGAVTFANSTYTPGTPTTGDYISGGFGTPTVAELIDGDVAELAIWKGNIGAAGYSQLNDRVSPLLVRPELLVCYFDLLGSYSPENDVVSGKSGTIIGSVPAAEHPRMFNPS